MTVTITLTQSEIIEAIKYSARVKRRANRHGPSYTGLECSDRYFVGKCGEIAVSKWAEINGLQCEETTRDDGLSDEQDHVFTTKQGLITTNVKNTHIPNARYLLQPVEQAKRVEQEKKYKQDYYVGASGKSGFPEMQVTLWGAIAYDQWLKDRKRLQLQIDSYGMLLKQLPIDMHDFAQLLV